MDRNATPHYAVVFLAFSNPADQSYLQLLKKESTALRDILLPLDQSGKIKLLREESTDHQDIPKLLTRYRDQIFIFHYGGHADGQHLFFENQKGNVAGLAGLLGLQKNLKLVFLNGCSTQEQVRPYLEAGIPAVVATTRSIPDEEAAYFAERFYDALASAHGIEEAFRIASGALKVRSAAYRVGAKEVVIYRGIKMEEDLSGELPWRLYIQSGAEEVLNWSLADLPIQQGESGKNASRHAKGGIRKWLPAAVFMLALVALFTGLGVIDLPLFGKKRMPAANSVTVFVHGKNQGVRDLILQNKGKVELVYGDAVRSKGINESGQATFNGVPDAFFADEARVQINIVDTEGEPYQPTQPDSLYQLQPGAPVYLEVELAGLDKLFGVVKDSSGDFIDSVRVSVQDLQTFTDTHGWFELSIPPAKQAKFQNVRAFKEGYQLWEGNDIPAQTNKEIQIILKSKNQ